MSAQAHQVESGLGPFYDGAMHLLLSPGDLLGLLALALLAGRAGTKAIRLTALTVAATWLLAGSVGLQLTAAAQASWANPASLIALGALVALELKPAPPTVAALAGLYGVGQGLTNGAALSTLGAGWGQLLGIVATAPVLILLGSTLISPRHQARARLLARIAGSWIAAVGILMLGWTLQGIG
jgi:urease accessory protein